MQRQRKQYTGTFKAKAALETIKGQRTVQEIAASYGVHIPIRSQSGRSSWWTEQQTFSRRAANGSGGDVVEEAVRSELYQQIGKLQVEL